MASLLSSKGSFAIGDLRAFCIGRVVASEAELLTIATDPNHRRSGLGQSVMTALHTTASERGATTAFLEVAANNSPAIRLYERNGYTVTGHRKRYYKAEDGVRVDALVMSIDLATSFPDE